MKLGNKDKFVFIAMGVTALNTVLMANGIETMPNMWVKEVYEDSMLGASIGGITGVGLGGIAGGVYIAASETVKAGVSLLREKFTKPDEFKSPKLG